MNSSVKNVYWSILTALLSGYLLGCYCPRVEPAGAVTQPPTVSLASKSPQNYVTIKLHRNTYSAEEQDRRVEAVLDQVKTQDLKNVTFYVYADPDTPVEALNRVIKQLRDLALPALWWGSLHTTGYLAVLVAQAAIMAFLPPAFLVATIASRWLNPVLIRQIAYASFAMYLLHRLTVGLPSTLYAPTAAWPSLVYLYGLWLPLTFVSAWVVQRIYDYCYKAVTAPSR